MARRRPTSKAVTAADAPAERKPPGPEIRLVMVLLSNPPDPERLIRGKYPARATPIWALAAATRLSATATSGRRSIRSEGTPTGIRGGGVCQGAKARLKVE